MPEPSLAFTLISLGVVAPIMATIITAITARYSNRRYRRDFKKRNGIEYDEFLSLYYPRVVQNNS